MIAIVPARGGSKGLLGKNIKSLLGKPLIAYTIEAALKSKYISNVIVSTDDQEICDIAVSYGALCPFLRPKSLATDTAMAVDNYIYTIDRLNSEHGFSIENFVVLQPTSPLRNVVDIDGAISLFKEKNADSVISYVIENHPVTWHKYIDNELKFENIFNETLNNRQDNRSSYYPNGAIFVFDYDLIKQKRYYSDKTYAYVMPRQRSVDIDYIEDFEYAEYLLRKIESD